MSASFVLPGAEELLAYQDLIGGDEEPESKAPGSEAPGACAYRLCGLLSCARVLPDGMDDKELLEECVGFLPEMNADQKQVSRLLERLWQVYQEEMQTPPASPEATRLSVLPLFGAWWTGSRFTARCRLTGPADSSAAVVLMDEVEHALASLSLSASNPAGLLTFVLPEEPCMLHLGLAVFRGDSSVEYRRIPVPVGARGPLEFAYASPASILVDKNL